MQLRTIKLIGFKSFVDPTVIHIEGDMTAIVGPNGCGKSNVVDAIRWVIGETSAKQLRGQSMSDVIFNGTTSRKPAGKAAVELIFDKAQGALSGEYAQYSEISIRREVERDGVSTYFINGVVGRRRDILDLFLGTGLGSRSYSVIEQGMISRLIEAKPEDLRSHLEEVAGISKYKERRRETENRMGHTRDNLDRLNDVREEVSKQLRHLKRQANAAKRYQDYQSQQQQLSAEIKAAKWDSFQQDLLVKKEAIESGTLQCDQLIAEQSGIETSLTAVREEQLSASDQYNVVQKQFYTLGESIARLEQQIEHHEQQSQQWQKELSAAEATWIELTHSVADQQGMVEELQAESGEISPHMLVLEQAVSNDSKRLAAAESAYQSWRSNWDKGLQLWSKTAKELGVAKNTLSHFDREQLSLQSQAEQCAVEQETLARQCPEIEIAPLKTQLNEAQTARDKLEQKMGDTSQSIALQREIKSTLEHEVAEAHHHLQQHQARHTALEALQQSALGSDDQSATEWLRANNLDHTPRLGEELQVEAGWEAAVEMVLGCHVEAQCIHNIHAVAHQAQALTQGSLCLIGQSSRDTAVSSSDLLTTKVKSSFSLDHWLSNIYIADTLDEAQRLLSSLSSNDSVITPEGVWLGHHWMKVSREIDPEVSVLVRQRELEHLGVEIQKAEGHLEEHIETLQVAKSHLHALESQRDIENDEFKVLTDTLSQRRSDLKALTARQQSWRHQYDRAEAALAENQYRTSSLQVHIQQEQEKVLALSNAEKQHEEERSHLEQTKGTIEQALSDARHTAQASQLQFEQAQSKITHQQRQLSLLEQTINREKRQLEYVSHQRAHLQEQLSSTGSPLQGFQAELQALLDQRLVVEKQLHQADDHLQELMNQLTQIEQERSQKDKRYKALQQSLQASQVDHQTLTVKQAALSEQLTALGHQPQELLSTMTLPVELSTLQEELERVQLRIERLGPINLAAIDEHAQLSEREVYLEQQHADLTEAIRILEGAIAKIDKSTRSMFRDTFQAINQSFSELFPSIFGGGKARLELTESDYLTTGVQVMAQPPGKRNATIHMLSGGEKALTAIALVFSMFKLNPAPFCILDEVDAPLDDVNVGRYCNLLRAMAGNIQFLVISHNKVTISMADRLLGVTMQEAGVSRLVSVDMQAAIEMTEV